MKFVEIVFLLVGNFALHGSGEYIAQRLRPPHFKPQAVYNPSLQQEPHLLPGIHHSSGCSVSIKNLAKPQPLFIKPNTDAIWPYSDAASIDLAAGQNVEIYCKDYANPAGKAGNLTATCVSGQTFRIDKADYDLTQITCQSWPEYTARKNGAKCNGGVLLDAGFPVDSRFVKQMTICFDENEEVTRYVHHTLAPGIGHFKSTAAGPKFITAGFFAGKDVDKLYSVEGVSNNLGSVINIYQTYFKDKDHSLTQGHLAATGDFVYANEQRGTFLFVNAAPQWVSFNAGNWAKTEMAVRNWVAANNLHVDCYTGVYGVSSLPDTKSDRNRMYLHYDERGNKIPVPILYFRVIIEPTSKRGIVLIGVNNPYIEFTQDRYLVCTDISAKIPWLDWDRTDKNKGYPYACEVAEFVRVNPNLPTFDVKSLLV